MKSQISNPNSDGTPTLLLQQFETLSDTHGALPKLRSLILDLAIRGAMVPQDPEDPPALKLVQLATASTQKERKRPSNGQTPSEPPFPIPQNWCWTRLDELGDTAPRNALPDKTKVGFSPMRLVTAKFGDPITFEPRPWAEVRKGFTHFADGDVVAAKITPCFENGKSGVIRGAPNGYGAGTTELHVFRPVPECVLPEYVLIFLKSPHFLINGERHMTGSAGQKRVPWVYFAGTPFPLPPLPEQRRIVAKVEELLALCDELEARQTTAREHRTRLVHSALDHLTTAKEEQDFRNRASFILHKSPFVLEDLPALGQAILSLAVRGKLGTQDANDEPASGLLSSITRDRGRAVKAKQMRKQKPVLPYENDLPFELPRGWAWSQLGNLTAAQDNAMCDGPFGSKLKTEHYTDEPGYAVIRLGNIGVGRFIWGKQGYISRKHYESLPNNHTTPGDLIVAGLADPLVRCCEVPAELGPAVNKADCFRLRLHAKMNSTYVQHYLNSPTAKALAAEVNHGITRERINLANAKSLPIPIPPLAEQARIVDQVEQLMRWCEQLQTHLAAAQTGGVHLLDAILRKVLDHPKIPAA